jgi:hypothetical protein
MLKLIKHRRAFQFMLDLWALIEQEADGTRLSLTKSTQKKLQKKWKETATDEEINNVCNKAVQFFEAVKACVSI